MDQQGTPPTTPGNASATTNTNVDANTATAAAAAVPPSSTSSGSSATTQAFQPDENAKTLYVGNLDPTVNETVLQEIFSQTGGQVENVKIIRDRNAARFGHHANPSYGFVEFTDHATAEMALQTMNGRRIYNNEIKVNWAFAGQNANKDENTSQYHIFVGDLSPEVNDELLSKAFGVFGSMTDARVMWDANSGKSRGYGFAAFRERADAERAIASMNGQPIGNRIVRCNWATQRGVPGPALNVHHHHGSHHHHGGHHHHQGGHHGNHHGGNAGGHHHNNSNSNHHQNNNSNNNANNFNTVVNQTPVFNTTVYIGNLPPHTTQDDLTPLFQTFGGVVDIRLQADRGFAFVKLDSHDKAANAILRLSGTMVNGRPAKVSWGKDRAAENAARNTHYGYYNNGAAAAAAAAAAGYPMAAAGIHHHHHNNNGYGYSNYNNFNQYGGGAGRNHLGGHAGFPYGGHPQQQHPQQQQGQQQQQAAVQPQADGSNGQVAAGSLDGTGATGSAAIGGEQYDPHLGRNKAQAVAGFGGSL